MRVDVNAFPISADGPGEGSQRCETLLPHLTAAASMDLGPRLGLKIGHGQCKLGERRWRGEELCYHPSWCTRCSSGLVSRLGADLCCGLITQQSATSLNCCWLKTLCLPVRHGSGSAPAWSSLWRNAG